MKEQNQSRIFLVAHSDITSKNNRYFKTFSPEKNEMLYGYYLFDAHSALPKHNPLFYLPIKKGTTFFWRLAFWSLTFLQNTERRLYTRMRLYKNRSPLQQILYLAAEAKPYNRHIFFLENFQLSEKFLVADETTADIIIYADQNGKIGGLYLKKNICIKENAPIHDAQSLYNFLQSDYETLKKENFIFHYNEQDLGLSVLQIEKESRRAAPQTVAQYQKRIHFLLHFFSDMKNESMVSEKNKQK